jgi:hypothetical protein
MMQTRDAMRSRLSRPRWSSPSLAILIAALVCVEGAASAQDIPDPKVAVPILLKVITYDKAFSGRGAGDFVLLVVSEPGQANTREEVLTTLRTLKLSAVQNRPLRFVTAEFKDESSLAAKLDAVKPSALLAIPGISSPGVQLISEAAQKRQIYSLALDASMVERNLALGVVAREGKPQIVINVAAAKAVGANFETAVLKIAKMVQ